jgi:ribosomal peptide maturation radical SAM protein 1
VAGSLPIILDETVDALIIVPPTAGPNMPSLAGHLLQACAAEAGFRVQVWYASLHLAATVGIERYRAVASAPFNLFVGERLFAASAYGVPPFGRDGEAFLGRHTLPEPGGSGAASEAGVPVVRLTAAALREVEARVGDWVEDAAGTIADHAFPVVGCTTMFEQTAASVSLLRRIKARRPQVLTVMGGPNCEGPMAEGVASLTDAVDVVFSGESEETFIAFLETVKSGQPGPARIVRGRPCRNLDGLPTPRFDDYFRQLAACFPGSHHEVGEISLPYESSRGCWWGEKHHCTFCGLNGEGMVFRKKAPARVLGDLGRLVDDYTCARVSMTDNIMPFDYFQTLIPQMAALAQRPGFPAVFYEQKANLSLRQVLALKAAGIRHIQPGIEALSTSLLRRMDKGVSGGQNVTLLRYARSAQMTLSWNILWGFPGDELRDYEETAALLPLLQHLPPPELVAHIMIDRFSPYFERPGQYGIVHLGPWPGLAEVLPEGTDVHRVAYHFSGTWPSESREHPEVIHAIDAEVARWRKKYNSYVAFGPARIWRPPMLEVVPDEKGGHALVDTRGLPGTEAFVTLTLAQAAAALTSRPAAGDLEWALARKVGVMIDGRYVPLATATPEILLEFESEAAASGSLRAAAAH